MERRDRAFLNKLFVPSPPKGVRLDVGSDYGANRLFPSTPRARPHFTLLEAATVVGLVGGAAFVVIKGGPDAASAALDVLKNGQPTTLVGQEIQEETTQVMVTDYSKKIPVRTSPNRGDNIIGYTSPGNRVDAQPFYGVVYPSGQEGLGNFKKNDRAYGKWFRVKVPVRIEDKSGVVIVPINPLTGQPLEIDGYVSGNFVRPPTAQEWKKFEAQKAGK